MTLLFADGWFGPEPGDWQSVWLGRYPGSKRFVQDDWDAPVREDWVARLDEALAEATEPPVLVAHSLGCLTVLHWLAAGGDRPVRGALFVTPPDVEENPEPALAGFAPIPRLRLPFPAVVAASSNDRWMTPARARYFAEVWGAGFADIGLVGHLTGAHGPWPEGEKLVAPLLREDGSGIEKRKSPELT
ncbi:RBBP9/YdeN family alpha/beta hydrolase [Amycolatopsis japonica]|uniref:RBBP9/YdeN family alpha/beta hydrolase n=1 Tax=Amycolatopsis japonica TaxID=208439 RepID=UPI00382C6A58